MEISIWLRIWLRVRLACSRGLDAFEHAIDEGAFRVALAWRILLGRVPIQSDRRWWNRATETPILADMFDWTTDRLIFSVRVWPPLEGYTDQRERLDEVLEAFARGASDKAWSTYWELTQLAWDHARECWVDADGHAYDGERMFAYSRGIGAVGEYTDPGAIPGGRGNT